MPNPTAATGLPTDLRATALAAEIDLEPLPEVSGSPAATSGYVELGAFGDLTVGVWEMTAGVTDDTEVDELFVVVAGRAEVQFLDSGETIELGPGSVVRLSAGQRTRWSVHETLRKIYIS